MFRLLVFFLTGVFYSCLFPIFGGSFSFYLFSFSLIHSILFGTIFALIASLAELLSVKRLLTEVSVSLGAGLHFGVWLISRSSFQDLSDWYVLPAGVLVTALIYGFLRVMLKLGDGQWGKITSLALVLVLILLKGYGVTLMPIESLDRLVPVRAKPPETSSLDFLYPFSNPLTTTIGKFPFLVPDFPTDRVIVVMVADAMNDSFLGKKVGGAPITPRLNQLTEEGMSYDQYYVQAPWTKPSTASLFTGQYVHEHGVCLSSQKYGQRLPVEHRTLAERLDSRGFLTVGTAFASYLNERYQFDQGFDFYRSPDASFRRDFDSLQQVFLKILRQQPRRLFVYMHIKGPHSPYQEGMMNHRFLRRTEYYEDGTVDFSFWDLPNPMDFSRGQFDQWKEKESNELETDDIKGLRYVYASQLNFVDRHLVGGLIDGLRSAGLYDPGLFVVTADHGEDLFHMGYNVTESPFRRFGHLTNLRELVINPPLILKPPTGEASNFLQPAEDSVVESVDLSTTLVDFAKADTQAFSGSSMLRPSSTDDEEVFRRALTERCSGRAKLAKEITDKVGGHDRESLLEKVRETIGEAPRTSLNDYIQVVEATLVDSQWKLLNHFPSNKTRLFNLAEDPMEEKPLRKRDRSRSMKQQMIEMMGGNNLIKGTPGKFVPMTEEEKNALKGLGYIN